MPRLLLPLSVVYQTEGATPLADVIAALQAAEVLIQDAASLLPSVVDGLEIDSISVTVRSVTEGSLREAFILAVLATYHQELAEEVVPLVESILGIGVSEKYDTLVTLAVVTLLFYGATTALDFVVKAPERRGPKLMLEGAIRELSASTGKSEDELRRIIDAKYSKPKPMRRLVTGALQWFRPSHRDGNAPIMVDRLTIPSEIVREVPPSDALNGDNKFDRFAPHNAVELELHAMDKDRGRTGWAAIAKGISDRRLKMKVMEPLTPADLWGRDRIIADVVVVSRLTAHGYTPAEIHLTSIVR